MKRMPSLVSLVLVLALLLTACAAPGAAPAPDDTTAVEGGAETGEETATECENVTLDYWNPFTGPDGPFMGEIVDSFNAEHPNIEVIMTTQSEYYTQLATAAASNTLPDVAIVHADQIATQAFRNILRPIDEVIAGMDIDPANFPTEVWNAGEVSGSRYAIPLDIHPMVLFYNADLLQEAGIDPATFEDGVTGEEFEAAAAAITETGNSGFMLTTGFPIRQIFEQMLQQAGGQAFNDEGTEVLWDSPEGVQALEWLRNAQTQWGEENLEVDAELNAFKGGTVGMVWNGIWQTTNLTGDAVGFEGRGTAVPQIFDNAATWAGSHQLTLPAQTDADACRDEAAGVFISYLLDNSVTWAAAGQIPASQSVRESEEFQALQPQASIAPSVEGAFFPPAVPGINDAYAPLDEAVAAVMAGQETDIEAALASAAERAEQILVENQANYGETLP